jgi:hypothetical protein
VDGGGVEPVEVDVEGFGVGFLEGDGGRKRLLLLFGCVWRKSSSGFEEGLQEGGVFGEDVCVGVEGGLLVGCCGLGVEEFDGDHGACCAGEGVSGIFFFKEEVMTGGFLLDCFCFWSDAIWHGTFVRIVAGTSVEDRVDR